MECVLVAGLEGQAKCFEKLQVLLHQMLEGFLVLLMNFCSGLSLSLSFFYYLFRSFVSVIYGRK